MEFEEGDPCVLCRAWDGSGLEPGYGTARGISTVGESVSAHAPGGAGRVRRGGWTTGESRPACSE